MTTTTRHAEILRLRALGVKVREIATIVGTSTHTVEHAPYGNSTSLYRPKNDRAPVAAVRRQCLRCRKWLDMHPMIFRCDACREATRDVFEGVAGVSLGASRKATAE